MLQAIDVFETMRGGGGEQNVWFRFTFTEEIFSEIRCVTAGRSRLKDEFSLGHRKLNRKETCVRL